LESLDFDLHASDYNRDADSHRGAHSAGDHPSVVPPVSEKIMQHGEPTHGLPPFGFFHFPMITLAATKDILPI